MMWAVVIDRVAPTAPPSAVRATSLRARLLLGLGFALAVPFVGFAVLARAEVGRRTGEVGERLLDVMARDTSNRLGARLGEARRLVDLIIETPVVRARLAGTADDADWRRWLARMSVQLGAFDGVVLVAKDGRMVLRWQKGEEVIAARGGDARALVGDLLDAVRGRGAHGFLEPLPDPLAEEASVEASRDPERYVLPLVVPMHDDTQADLGAGFFLVPMRWLQAELDRTIDYLRQHVEIAQGEAYVLAAGRHVLHTDRARLGSQAAADDDTGFVRVAAAVEAVPALGWSVGVRADRRELLARSTGNLVGFFLVLALLVLGAALGIATLISLAATRSLRALETVTERLGQGDLRQRAEVGGPRETRKLALALNTMAAQLEAGRERLRTAERDRAWTAMARQVAHEIKNPLQPVKLHAELVQRVFGKTEIAATDRDRGRASAEVILRQVDALQRIVADFSAFAQAGQPAREGGEGFLAGEVLRQVEALYAAGSERGVRVAFEPASADARLLGSALRLQQVLVNLIKNAVEASPDGGTVEVGHGVHGERWRVEVRDRGPGLAPDLLVHAFEPSFSTKPGGTGLGLAISQRNVDAMGGRIELLARDGGGLVARVELDIGKR